MEINLRENAFTLQTLTSSVSCTTVELFLLKKDPRGTAMAARTHNATTMLTEDRRMDSCVNLYALASCPDRAFNSAITANMTATSPMGGNRQSAKKDKVKAKHDLEDFFRSRGTEPELIQVRLMSVLHGLALHTSVLRVSALQMSVLQMSVLLKSVLQMSVCSVSVCSCVSVCCGRPT